uniref:Ciliary neurotrophic factor n=1 Tax=Kryptolebias marmoratus TaxID=37003 RepID=A0A3Q3A5B3_KRYMA
MLVLVCWGLVLPSPIRIQCDSEFQTCDKITNTVKHEAKELKDEYKKSHKLPDESVPVPDEVPSSTVIGSTISEKLQDIYTKNELFRLHLLKVKTYQKELLDKPDHLLHLLSNITIRLDHHLATIKKVLRCTDPHRPFPTSPPALKPEHKNDYQKKMYGWGVLVRLDEWSKEVLKVLKRKKSEWCVMKWFLLICGYWSH